MSTINIQQLRDKYRKIIQSQDSEQQTFAKSKISLSIKKGKSHMRVLTEHCENISHSKIKEISSNSVLVALKERIAQGLQNLSKKDAQIQDHKATILKQKAQIQSLELQLVQVKSSIEQNCTKIVLEKVNSVNLQKQIGKLKAIIEDHHVDKQLVFKQIQFYKKQIKDLKRDKKDLMNKLDQNKKQIQNAQNLKNDNLRLKENIKRMQVIINQCCRQSVKVDLTHKYYLGKPIKESNCWYSQNLVGEIQSFLRKWQIAHNNKDFINNLVKFVDSYQKYSHKSLSHSKLKSAKSMHKESDSKRYSTSVQFGTDASAQKSRVQNSIKKSILLNKYKKKNPKKYAQSLFEEENSTKVYEQMLDQYQKALKEALYQDEIKPKKIMLLSKELKDSFSNYMEDTKQKA